MKFTTISSDRKIIDFANSKTPSRLRAEAMGFTFSPVDVIYDSLWGETKIRGRFQCVCGRTEAYDFIVDLHFLDQMLWHRELDVARRLQSLGSFSRPHLLEDGYTEEQVEEIERRGADWDADGQST